MSEYKVKKLSIHMSDAAIKERIPVLRQSFYEAWLYRYLYLRC